MVMVLASRILGLVRNRVYVHYFAPGDLGTFLAAFTLPDTIFEILTNGIMASAFIPVFSKYLHKKEKMEAWYVSAITLNILLLFFAVFSIVILLFTRQVYNFITPGFSPEQIEQVVNFARIFLIAQMFFSASYLLGAILETHQRFIISSIAPLFYNLGIILTTVFFASTLGLYAPVLGVAIGAMLHFLVQLPFAIKLGFRPIFSLNFFDKGVQEIGKLAAPRLLELVFLRAKSFVDLFIASSFGSAGVTYFRFGDALTSLPTALFALSISKASLPQLSKLAVQGKMEEYKRTFGNSFKEILFLVLPISIFIAVLRLPIVRLVYGDAQFDWQSTLTTGYVVSAFSLGIFSYSLALLTTRAFYALQDTKTPVTIAIVTIIINAILGLAFLFVLNLPVWGLPLSSSISGIVQIIVLMILLSKKIGGFGQQQLARAFFKIITAASVAGAIMFILLKLLDRTVDDKSLWYLGILGLRLPTNFDNFLLDTHYTVNVIVLTFSVGTIGLLLYLLFCYILRVEELRIVARAVRLVTKSRFSFPLFARDTDKPEEPLNTPPVNNL